MMRALWRTRAMCVTLGAALICSGCMFRSLGEDLAHVNTLAMIQGHVTTMEDRDDPLVVVPQFPFPPHHRVRYPSAQRC